MNPTYEISADSASITCLRCGLTSYNPNDVENKFCRRCGGHEDPLNVAAFREYMRARMRAALRVDNVAQNLENRKRGLSD